METAASSTPSTPSMAFMSSSMNAAADGLPDQRHTGAESAQETTS